MSRFQAKFLGRGIISCALTDKQELFLLLLAVASSIMLAMICAYYSWVYVAAFALCLVSLWLFFKRQEWFLYFFAATRINLDLFKLFYFQDRLTGMRWGLSLDGVINAMLLACSAIYFTKKRKFKIFVLPGAKAYIAFLLICAGSLILSPDKLAAIRYLMHYFSYLLIYILGVNILDNRDKNYKMISAIFLSLLIPLAMGIYQVLTIKGDFSTPGFNRIFATTSHPNVYAIYLMVASILTLTMYLYTSSLKKKTILFLAAALVLVSLVLTYTRGAWFAVLAGMLAFFSLSPKKTKRKIIIFIFAIAPILILLNIFFQPKILERIFMLTSPGAESLGWRITVWTMNFREFLKQPLIGQGIASPDFIAKRMGGFSFAPHNDYIRLLVETGLAGFCAYLAIIFCLLKYFISKYRRSLEERDKILCAGLISVIISLLLQQFGENVLHYDNAFTYFWLFIVIGYNLLQES